MSDTCRRCTECPDLSHHWMEGFDHDEDDEIVSPDEPRWLCKHCDFSMPWNNDEPEEQYKSRAPSAWSPSEQVRTIPLDTALEALAREVDRLHEENQRLLGVLRLHITNTERDGDVGAATGTDDFDGAVPCICAGCETYRTAITAIAKAESEDLFKKGTPTQ